MAVIYSELGEYLKALEINEKAYALQCELLGEEHPDTLITLFNLALAYGDLGDFRKALELMEKVYALRCKVLGPDHEETREAEWIIKAIKKILDNA